MDSNKLQAAIKLVKESGYDVKYHFDARIKEILEQIDMPLQEKSIEEINTWISVNYPHYVVKLKNGQVEIYRNGFPA